MRAASSYYTSNRDVQYSTMIIDGDGTPDAGAVLTEAEEATIKEPFARDYYRSTRIALEAGHFRSPGEACARLKALFRDDARGWVLLLSLLVTCTLPPLLDMKAPAVDAKCAHCERVYIVAMLLSFACNIYSIQGCIMTALAIDQCPDRAVGRYLVLKFGFSSPRGFWHNFFAQKELTLLFLAVATGAKSYQAHGAGGVAVIGAATVVLYKLMNYTMDLNFRFANDATASLERTANQGGVGGGGGGGPGDRSIATLIGAVTAGKVGVSASQREAAVKLITELGFATEAQFGEVFAHIDWPRMFYDERGMHRTGLPFPVLVELHLKRYFSSRSGAGLAHAEGGGAVPLMKSALRL